MNKNISRKDGFKLFLASALGKNLLTEINLIRQRAESNKNHPDLLWRRLCSVASTSGSSVNARSFMALYNDRLRFDLLPETRTAREKAIAKVLADARIPRMREQKSKNLALNYEKVKALGGPEKATEMMLQLEGKRKKQAWIRQFEGVGQKYSNDIWMSINDPDFSDAIAIDARVKSFARELDFDIKSPKLENELLNYAKSCDLSGWEFDRLIYNFGSFVLRIMDLRSGSGSAL